METRSLQGYTPSPWKNSPAACVGSVVGVISTAAGSWSHWLALLIVCTWQATVCDWCNLDTGYTTITDGHGYPRSVFISATRDGSIWMRAGKDRMDWRYVNALKPTFKETLLEETTVDAFKSLNYSKWCVLTDLNFTMTALGGWHPSYVKVYDPRRKSVRIVHFKQHEVEDCGRHTNLSLSPDKQSLMCDGSKRHSCGLRNMPEKGQRSGNLFIKSVNLDPEGPDHRTCGEEEDGNSYTFNGSYYHVFIKLATCPQPADSRVFGHDPKLRAEEDFKSGLVLIPDPTQTALNHGTIRGWQVYVKITSIQHYVYLQVWRPRGVPAVNGDQNYTLVGQTFFKPTELRFQEEALRAGQYINVEKGDVLGLYFPKSNPLSWSAVPCAYPEQQYQYSTPPRTVVTGVTLQVRRAVTGTGLCRHYSFIAMLGNKTDSKYIEDWICPTAQPPKRARTDPSGGDQHAGGNSPDKASDQDPGYSAPDRNYSSDGAVPVHLVLIIIGGLLLLLIIVGFVSYYKAVSS